MAKTARRPAQPATPQSFGKYELLEEIGRGGMGVVFRARQTDLDRLVAIKMILSSRLASADDVGRFHAEAKAAGSLRHPNIVAIHDAGEVHGQHFFAMDFVEGRSLAQALADGPFEPKQAAECLAAIGKAVQYLHEHHIIHRDLKPSNILLAPDGTPFVTDFGLAKALAFDSPHTETGTMVGTLGYMPPEQTLGEPATPRSDVYSLGAILFELLTGRPPFQNASPFDTLMQVMEEDPPRLRKLNRNVPLTLEWICLKCLEKNPHNRYESAAALVDDLEKFLRGDPLLTAAPVCCGPSFGGAGANRPWRAHLGTLAVSALILQIKYMISGFDRPYHLMVMSVFAAWALAAVICCWLMRRLRLPDVVQYAWAAFDAAFLTLLLYVTPPEVGPTRRRADLGGLSPVDRRRGTFFPRAAGHIHDGRLCPFVRHPGPVRPRTDHPTAIQRDLRSGTRRDRLHGRLPGVPHPPPHAVLRERREREGRRSAGGGMKAEVGRSADGQMTSIRAHRPLCAFHWRASRQCHPLS